MLVSDSIVLTILNSVLLPITKDICVCTGQPTIRAYVLCYSKFDQEVDTFI